MYSIYVKIYLQKKAASGYTESYLFNIGLPEFESGTPCPPDMYANQLRYSP